MNRLKEVSLIAGILICLFLLLHNFSNAQSPATPISWLSIFERKDSLFVMTNTGDEHFLYMVETAQGWSYAIKKRSRKSVV